MKFPLRAQADRRGPRRSAALLAFVGAAAVLLAVTSPAMATSTSSAQQVSRPLADPWTSVTVTATPNTNLVDGQKVAVNIKTSDPNLLILKAAVQLCRPGVSYQPSTDLLWAPDFNVGGANCPQNPMSSSADGIKQDTYTNPDANTPAGDTVQYRVGTGVQTWTDPTNTKRTLSCDPNNPCALVVELHAQEVVNGVQTMPLSWRPFVEQVGFGDSNPIAACGGPAKGIVSTSGIDALQEMWVNWTIAACKQAGQHGALTGLTYTSEGGALTSFVNGSTDLAYTTVGYNPVTRMVPTDAETKRPMVAVPVGLGSVVLAVGGGYLDDTNRWRPYDQQPKLSVAEFTTLLAGGPQGNINAHMGDITARNPELGSPFMFTAANQSSGTVLMSASSGPESSSWLATRFAATLDNPEWTVPNLPLFGVDAGRPRTIDADLGAADPGYTNAVTLLSGRPLLAKSMNGVGDGGGGAWTLTDLTTADALGLVSTQLQNSAGEFVPPNNDTMQAAIAGMTPTQDGMLVSDPEQTQGYPLTYVLYALAPTQPLADAANNCRTDSQKLLTDWLTYATGVGQTNLPAGLAPLTPALQTQAQAAVKKVGATAAKTPCKGPITSPTQKPAGTSAGGGGGSVTDVGGTTAGGLVSSAVGSDLSTTSGGAGSAAANAAKRRVAASLATTPNPSAPRFGGDRTPSLIAGLIALVGLVGLLALTAAWSSGWRPRSRGGPTVAAPSPSS